MSCVYKSVSVYNRLIAVLINVNLKRRKRGVGIYAEKAGAVDVFVVAELLGAEGVTIGGGGGEGEGGWHGGV